MAHPPHRQRHELPGDPDLVRVGPERTERERADGVLVFAGGDSLGRAEPARPASATWRSRAARRSCSRRTAAICASEGEILSPDGHCRPFDDERDRNAVRRRRRLRAAQATVRRGRRRRSDPGGRPRLRRSTTTARQKVGFLAPSVDGQARVISEALAVAGVSAETSASSRRTEPARRSAIRSRSRR